MSVDNVPNLNLADQPNPNAGNADQLATLAEHDRIVRSTRVPAFTGNASKDMKALDWMGWFENAIKIGRWNTDERKIAEFNALLRDDARRWYTHMTKLPGLDIERWSTIRNRFLENYDQKNTAKTICYNFQNLIQKPRERVTDFYTRVSEVFTKLEPLYPESFDTVKLEEAEEETMELAKLAKKEGLKDMSEFFLTQLFLAGMHEKLRTKIQESGLTGLLAIHDKANELEKLEVDHKDNVPKICAIREEAPQANPTSPSEDLDEDEIAAINAVRKIKGKGAYSGAQGGAKKKLQCRYCRKFGHMQKVCHSRIRDNAPMVGEDGKPYQPRGQPGGGPKPHFAVKGIQNDDDDEEPDVVGYVNNIRHQGPAPLRSLNW